MSEAGNRILIIGGTGQIGYELVRELAPFGLIVAPSHRELDLAEPLVIRDWLARVRPALVVNAAAYTAVDRAESEADTCSRINADAPAFLAAECKRLNAALIHFSTDYVFDGRSERPYVESDPVAPVNVYGRSKLAGEQGIAAAGGASLIFRTSWVYAARGNNFARTMLKLSHERSMLSIVDDQVGAPTSAPSVARGVAAVLKILVQKGPSLLEAIAAAAGVYHMTASGETTWYEFAHTILLDDRNASEQACRDLRAIRTADYATAAMRPLYSVLDNSKLRASFGVRLPDWQSAWREVAKQLSATAPRA